MRIFQLAIGVILLTFSSCKTTKKTTGNAENGKQIYKVNCASCHNMKIDMVGPSFQNLFERLPSEEWFIEFVSQENQLLKNEDQYTVSINSKWNATHDHKYANLSDQDYKDLIEYIKTAGNTK